MTHSEEYNAFTGLSITIDGVVYSNRQVVLEGEIAFNLLVGAFLPNDNPSMLGEVPQEERIWRTVKMLLWESVASQSANDNRSLEVEVREAYHAIAIARNSVWPGPAGFSRATICLHHIRLREG